MAGDYRVTEGTLAPDFTLPDADGKDVKLSDLRGRKLILYFYPKDSTPGCTTEACDFRDTRAEFEALGALVLGVSKDSQKSHVRFRDKHELSFPLLSDPEHTVLEAYDVWREKKLYGKTSMGTERSTFLIDEEGVIRKAWRKVKVKGHVEEVLQAVRAL